MFNTERELISAQTDFSDTVVNGVYKCTPSVRNRNSPKYPWATQKIRKLADIKRRKWDNYKNERNDANYEEYKKALNRFTREKNEAIRMHEQRLVKNKKSSPKPYYKYLSSKSKYRSNQVSLLNNENTTVSD